MKTTFLGILSLSADPRIGENSLAHFLQSAREAKGEPTKGTVSVEVAGRAVSASAQFDPRSNTLTLSA